MASNGSKSDGVDARRGADDARNLPVMVVHGLWMNGVEATVLRHRLVRGGFETQQFHYRSASASLDSVIDEFRERLLAIGRPVHLVGHSLGGLLVLRIANRCPEIELGRVVLLGSPVNGSRAARAFVRMPGTSYVFGALAQEELIRPQQRRWQRATPIGILAGTRPAGLGRIIAGFGSQPNDGTVGLDETRLAGATDTLVLPVSHLGMMLSEQVALQVLHFLRHGGFEHSAVGAADAVW